MKTTIDNNQRVFLVRYDSNNAFCNLAQLPEVFSQIETGYLPYTKIFHFWNGDKKRISKHELEDMCIANKVDATFLRFILPTHHN